MFVGPNLPQGDPTRAYVAGRRRPGESGLSRRKQLTALSISLAIFVVVLIVLWVIL
jgi:hypothetical protein